MSAPAKLVPEAITQISMSKDLLPPSKLGGADLTLTCGYKSWSYQHQKTQSSIRCRLQVWQVSLDGDDLSDVLI